MRRSPVRVRSSSTSPMYLEPSAMRRARPPVAMVRVSGPSSAIMRCEDAVDEADVAVVEADLEVVDGVGADDLGGLADVDAGEAGGAEEERVGGDAEAWSDGSADVFAARGDDVEGGGGAEVDDDDGGPSFFGDVFEEVEGGDAVDDAVCADFGGIVGADGETGAGAGLDEEGLDVEVELGGAAEDGIERRDDGGDGDAGDGGDIERAEAEEAAEEDAELVGGDVALGGDAPVGEELGGVGRGEAVETEDRVGVAYVDG